MKTNTNLLRNKFSINVYLQQKYTILILNNMDPTLPLFLLMIFLPIFVLKVMRERKKVESTNKPMIQVLKDVGGAKWLQIISGIIIGILWIPERISYFLPWIFKSALQQYALLFAIYLVVTITIYFVLHKKFTYFTTVFTIMVMITIVLRYLLPALLFGILNWV